MSMKFGTKMMILSASKVPKERFQHLVVVQSVGKGGGGPERRVLEQGEGTW